ACNPGFANCDGAALNGCEINTTNDRSNCGRCGTVCPTPAHASPGCNASVCGIGACQQGWNNCNGMAGDGCETNCGAGRSCAGGATSTPCAGGWLGITDVGRPSARAFAFYAVVPARQELLVWGGTDLASTPAYFADGARYNW